MVVGCIVQARMGSSRLPGKTMKKLDSEKPLLYYVIDQLNHSKLIEQLVVATTTLDEDNKIEEFLKKTKTPCFRGNPTDVLDRYFKCAKEFSFSIIVRITADNPLIDPTIVDQVITEFNNDSYDYVTNHTPRTFPQGTEVEVFSFNALENAWKNARKLSEREHVTPYFYNNPSIFKLGKVMNTQNLSHLRWTVDHMNDLNLIKTIITKINKRPILLNDILELLQKESELFKINENHIIDEGYNLSLRMDKSSSKTI